MIRSTLFLILISAFAKILSFLVRILLARNLSSDAMNYYTLAAPTMVLVITLAQMGIPSALSKVIAQSKQIKPVMKSSILLCICNNILIAIVYTITIPFLARFILKETHIQPILYTILPLLPLVTLSGLLKGYLYGIQEHMHATSAQIYEELSRILFLLFAFSFFQQPTAIQLACISMLSVSIGEFCSILYLLFCLKLPVSTIKKAPRLFHGLEATYFHEILNVSLPMTGSRIIGTLTYFLEPIFMVIGLQALQQTQMVSMYGTLNGYVLPLITMPSFITITLSNFLLPSFTYYHSRNKMEQVQKLSTTILFCCFLVGCVCSFLCFAYSEPLLQLFYHNTKGSSLLKLLAWPFALYSLQAPLASMLHALSLSKKAVLDTFYGSLARLLCVLFLTPIVHEYSLVIGICVGMLITTLAHALRLLTSFQKKRSLKK